MEVLLCFGKYFLDRGTQLVEGTPRMEVVTLVYSCTPNLPVCGFEIVIIFHSTSNYSQTCNTVQKYLTTENLVRERESWVGGTTLFGCNGITLR